MSKSDAVSEFSLVRICAIMGWSVLRWSSACRHDMESVNIKNLFLLECSMHSRAGSISGRYAFSKIFHFFECYL